MDLQLTGRRALVTGATQGLGRASAIGLAAEGTSLAITGRRVELLEEVADEIQANTGRRPATIVADLMEPEAPNRLAQEATNALGAVDILVNSAGGTERTGFDSQSEVWDRLMVLNFVRVRELTHALVPAMRVAGFGRIVNITGSVEPNNMNAAHPAKAAVQAWSKGLSWELAKDGITVNALQPGRIMSEQVRNIHYPTEEAQRAFAEQNIPMGRFGEPEEFAVVVTLLCSPLASYVTGASIPVDGGLKRASF